MCNKANYIKIHLIFPSTLLLKTIDNEDMISARFEIDFSYFLAISL